MLGQWRFRHTRKDTIFNHDLSHWTVANYNRSYWQTLIVDLLDAPDVNEKVLEEEHGIKTDWLLAIINEQDCIVMPGERGKQLLQLHDKHRVNAHKLSPELGVVK